MILRLIGLVIMVVGAWLFLTAGPLQFSRRNSGARTRRWFGRTMQHRWGFVQLSRPRRIRLAYAMTLFLAGAALLMGTGS
jgi:hypothetical protein